MTPNELEWTAGYTGDALEAKIKNLIDILRVRAGRKRRICRRRR